MRVYLLPVAAMALVVLASNILVQFPMAGTLGPLALGDLLTWGAFTYPFAFLVTDLTNRLLGPVVARRAVYAGFAVAVATSILVPPILFSFGLLPFETVGERLGRIAVASGTAFITAQLLDITVFNRLRRGSWWKAPIVGSVSGSVVDTAIFFTVAFSAAFALVGPGDEFATAAAPLLGLFPAAEAPRWVSWALGDLCVKLLIAFVALVPYRLVIGMVLPPREINAAA